MGNDYYEKYNNEKKMPINIELNKVCYFPEEIITGTITIFPRLETIDALNESPELTIKLKEYLQYTYTTKNGKHTTHHTVSETKFLIEETINFKDSLTLEYSAGIKIPFSYQIPKEVHPTMFLDFYDEFCRHFFMVEVPCCEAIRTKALVMRNTFPEKVLTKNYEAKSEFNKSKLFSEKGSVLCKVKMPKNYFFYDEEIPFEINIDCSKLDLKIKSVKVYLFRKALYKMRKDSTEIRRKDVKEIYFKEIHLEKGLTNYNVFNSINFPTKSDVYPPNLYEEFEKHGLYEVNDKKIKESYYKLYPGCRTGLLTVEYYLKIKLHFDSLFTFDESIDIPLYFTENNNLNLSLKNQVFNLATYKYEIDDNLIQYTSTNTINS